jgi:hypothetical protein
MLVLIPSLAALRTPVCRKVQAGLQGPVQVSALQERASQPSPQAKVLRCRKEPISLEQQGRLTTSQNTEKQ